ncbi:MAG: site-specific DNA-methyltransferase [Nannocystaceae bacterium]
MRKIDLQTNGLSTEAVAKNVEALRAVFPEACIDGRVDHGALQRLLGHPSCEAREEEHPERYGLAWNGKRKARGLAQIPCRGTLRPCPKDSVNWDGTKNLFIEGDNLEVLKLLQSSYHQKAGLIYIDPPYNTGKDFVYPDDFGDSIKNYLRLTGQVRGRERNGARTEVNGRFHTNWLNMMYPRLQLARPLLRDDGLICISIDDKELHNLRLICDEIFGEESFVGMLTWVTTTQPDNIGRARFGLQQNIEYVLVYSKCRRIKLPPFVLRPRDAPLRYPHSGRFGPCRFEIIERAFEGAYARPTMRYSILGQPPRPRKQWQIGEKKARVLEEQGRLEIVNGVVKRAIYPEDEVGGGKRFVPFWAHLKEVQTTQSGKAELTKLLGAGHGVDTVKPVSLITELLGHLPSDAIVIDFFAGSGTSGHAVMSQNLKDAGSRRYILVQWPGPLDPGNARQRSSAEFCASINRPACLTEIAKERLRRVGELVEECGSGVDVDVDVGFRVFKLAARNEAAPLEAGPEIVGASCPGRADRISCRRAAIDMLYERMLVHGIPLSATVESCSVSGETVHIVAAGELVACFAADLTHEFIEGLVALRAKLDVARVRVVVAAQAFSDEVTRASALRRLAQGGVDDVTWA